MTLFLRFTMPMYPLHDVQCPLDEIVVWGAHAILPRWDSLMGAVYFMVCHQMAASCSSHNNAIFAWQHGSVMFDKLKYNSHAYKKASRYWSILYIPIVGFGLLKFDVGRQIATAALNHLLHRCLCSILCLLCHLLNMNLQSLQTMLNNLHFGNTGCYTSSLCSIGVDNLHYLLCYILQCRLQPALTYLVRSTTLVIRPCIYWICSSDLLKLIALTICVDALLHVHTYKGIVENFQSFWLVRFSSLGKSICRTMHTQNTSPTKFSLLLLMRNY